METRPKHQRVADSLRDRIAASDLPAWPLVPGERELTAEYAPITRETVRKALRTLENEGRIFTRDRRRYVREYKPITLRVSAEETIALIEDAVRGGHVLDPPVILVKIEGGSTLVREVRRRVDGNWHNWAKWRFPLDVAQGTRLAYEEDIEQGSIRYLKEGLGWTVTQETPYYDFRPPAPEERMLLNTTGWVIVEHRAGTMEHPAVSGERQFSAVRILCAGPTRIAP